MSYRLLVFDWDGTLRDSVASIVGCALAALADVGRTASEEAIRGTIGLGLDEAVARFSPGLEGEELARVVERYRHHWLGEWHARGALFPGVEAMLAELEGRGYLLAVATGKSRVGLVRDFEHSGVERHFHASRTADETAAKPSPAMLLELMEELGTRPETTLMIGDTGHDLAMARNARVEALGVTCGAHRRDELLVHSPLELLERTSELVSWLERRR